MAGQNEFLRPKAFKKKAYTPDRFKQNGAAQTPSAKQQERAPPRIIEPPSFAVPGLSLASAFVLELVQSRVPCVPASRVQSLPYAPALGSSMEVRRGLLDGEVVAVKEVRTAVKDYGKALANALFEIRVMAHKPLASHRNIVSLRTVAFADDASDHFPLAQPTLLKPMIVVDWALGDLTSHLLEKSLDFTESAELVADIADGLQILHLYGITHADLKPDNVLLFVDPESHSGLVAKLADFGFSGSEEHRQERKGLTSRWSAPAVDGADEYLMTNTECPGDVFSFGLVAMFVAIAQEWDPDCHLPDWFDPDVQREKFDDSLGRIYNADDFARWHKILHSTVVSNPTDRLTTKSLGTVRGLLLGQDRYARERKHSMIHMIPFRGMKGAQNTYKAELEFSKLSFDFSAHARTKWKSLPAWMKTSIREDFMSFNLRPANVYKDIDDDFAIRIVAVALLGTILLTTEPTTYVLRRQPSLVYMAWRVHKAGTRLGIEDLEDRPPVWRLAAKNKDDDALDELRRDPSQLTYKHRGHTIVHYAALYGKPKILAGILEMAPETIHFVTGRGFTPLFYAAVCAIVIAIVWTALVISSFKRGAVIRTGISCYTLFTSSVFMLIKTNRSQHEPVQACLNGLTGSLGRTPLQDILTSEHTSSHLTADGIVYALVNVMGIILVDFLISEHGIYTLAPLCFAVEILRTNHRKSRFDREMQWIQRALHIDGEYRETLTPTRENARRSTQYKVFTAFQSQMRQAWRNNYTSEGKNSQERDLESEERPSSPQSQADRGH
ncbi:hypothetical protein PRZ48_013703 [Zasmidium cellare]|uniref:Protein kinase domain-containing protein n=1 Tax=Zasmidium cellare TaxID=395010 RepID=A0ABR0E1T1_ZASCE|nr:hypothetical protein PRZ48_013703 [Zasmidium cellare]